MRAALRCGVCLLLLSGCTAGVGDDESVGTESLAATVCAGGETVPGIDVSYYQGTIDWPAVRAAGITFAITRINHGGFMDPKFDVNWQSIREQTMVRGAYQYFNPGDDPAGQAQIVVDKVGMLEPGDMPCVIDVESTDGQSPATIAKNIQTWVEIVEQGTGRRPIIYTGRYFWGDNVGTDQFAGHPLWHAQYTSAACPNIADAWGDWAVWQYTSSGQVAGIAGNVDRNRFNGDINALHDFAANGYRATVLAVEYPPTMHAGENATAKIVLRNDGARTWDGGTRLGTSEPRDRESPFIAPSWLDKHRVVAVPEDVPSGAEVTLELELTAPAEPGEYVEHFNLVQDGVAWFSDTPPGGGPGDDAIALSIVVEPAIDGSAGVGGDPEGGAGGAVVATAPIRPDNSAVVGGCATAPGHTSGGWTWLLAAAVALRLPSGLRRRARARACTRARRAG